MQSDADLIRGALDDPDLFRTLYDRYAPAIHRFLLRRTRDIEAALDLTAETFAQAWLSRRRFRDAASGSAAPWLFTIAKRVLISSVKRSRLETRALDELRVQTHASHDHIEPSNGWIEELDADVCAALSDLPPDQRVAIELRIIKDLPYADIARRVGSTPTAARIRVSRGLKRLRAALEVENR